MSWLQTSLELKLNEKILPNELKPHLEMLRRNEPTKFYMLEQDLIKFVRKEVMRPYVREIKPKVEEINLNKVSKKKDDDFESSDASGFIYS